MTTTATSSSRTSSDVSGGGAAQVWMLRVNPLARHRFADPVLAESLERLVALEAELVVLAQDCSEQLYALIGAATAEERSILIGLRRDIHNDRTPHAVPDGTSGAVARWVEIRGKREEVERAVERRVEAAVRHERDELVRILSDGDFRRAVALVAPEVLDSAQRYRAGSAGGAVSARLRKSERGLLQYATRAMMRTSPLSRFTAVGLLIPGSVGEPVEGIGFTGASAFSELDPMLLAHLAGAAPPAEGSPRTVWVQHAPTLRRLEGTQITYVRAAPSGAKVLSAPVTTHLHVVLELTAMGPRPLDAVVEDASRRLSCPVPAARVLVRRCLDAGILCEAAGPVQIFAEGALAGAAGPLSDDAAGPLVEAGESAEWLAHTDAEERGGLIARIERITGSLNGPAGPRPALLVNEDYLVRPGPVDVSGLRSRLADLADVITFQSAFDRSHEVRALLSAAFVERFGEGGSVPLVEHADMLVSTVYRRESVLAERNAKDLGPADGSLAALLAVRARAERAVGGLLDQAADTGATAWLAAAQLAELVSDLPERFTRGPVGYGVLVQQLPGELVLNDAYAGHGMLFGRFVAADHALGGDAGRRISTLLRERYGSDGAAVVEDLGLHGLSVNAHPPLLDRGLTAQDWYGLLLVHDADTEDLRIVDQDGAPLRIFALGTGHPELFPPALRIATWLYSGGRLVRDLVGRWHREREGDGALTAGCPRLVAGSVIVARQRWYGGQDFAAATEHPADAERLARLARWRARHGVPEEIMLKTPVSAFANRRDRPAPGAGRAQRQREKPQYVDLSSALLTRALPRFLERRREGFLEEALPAAGASPHATEWIVDAYRAAGGRFVCGVEES